MDHMKHKHITTIKQNVTNPNIYFTRYIFNDLCDHQFIIKANTQKNSAQIKSIYQKKIPLIFFIEIAL